MRLNTLGPRLRSWSSKSENPSQPRPLCLNRQHVATAFALVALFCGAAAQQAAFSQPGPMFPSVSVVRLLAQTYTTRDDSLRIVDMYLDRFRGIEERFINLPGGQNSLELALYEREVLLTADSLLALIKLPDRDTVRIHVAFNQVFGPPDNPALERDREVTLDLSEVRDFLMARILRRISILVLIHEISNNSTPEEIREGVEHVMNTHVVTIRPSQNPPVVIGPIDSIAPGRDTSPYPTFNSAEPQPLIIGDSSLDRYRWVVNSTEIYHDGAKHGLSLFGKVWEGYSLIIVEIYRQYSEQELGYFEVTVKSWQRENDQKEWVKYTPEWGNMLKALFLQTLRNHLGN